MGDGRGKGAVLCSMPRGDSARECPLWVDFLSLPAMPAQHHAFLLISPPLRLCVHRQYRGVQCLDPFSEYLVQLRAELMASIALLATLPQPGDISINCVDISYRKCLFMFNASYRVYLFAFLIFCVCSSKNIIIYNEETLVAASFCLFVLFVFHYFGNTVKEALDERG